MAIERAVNFPFRVQGLDQVRNAFRTNAAEGTKSFAQIEKSANGAAREVSSYTAQLRRAAEQAKADFANNQLLNKGSAAQVGRNRSAFILARVEAEKQVMAKGLSDLGGGLDAVDAAAARSAVSIGGVTRVAGLAGVALGAMALGALKAADAYSEHEKALDQFNATLAMTGNQSTASAGEISAAAEKVSAATLQTEKSSLSAASALARVPAITKDVLTDALDASARFADAVGRDVMETAEKTGTVLTAVADRDMKGLVDALEGTTPALSNLVIRLTEAGKTAEAQKAYVDGLRRAAGDGPDGLTSATDKLSDSWNRLLRTLAETSGVNSAVTGLFNWLGGLVDDFNSRLERTGSLWRTLAQLRGARPWDDGGRPGRSPFASAVNFAMGVVDSVSAQAERLRFQAYQKQYGGSGGGGRKGRGGGGKSDAEREAEKRAREAEQAREAADRIRKSNDEVIASYGLRAREAQARLGLEGEALAAVERSQAIDAAARQLSVEWIEKEVEAQRLASKGHFDEAAARAAATKALGAQQDAVRAQAAALYDADKAQEQFNERQRIAAQIYESTRTPLEELTKEIDQASEALRNGDISADTFNRRMDQLAEGMARAGEKGREAWRGIGREVSGTLQDIIRNGGTATEILDRLIGTFADRLWESAIDQPLGDWIDGLFGVNHEKNVASARATLPFAGSGEAEKIAALGTQSDRAAQEMQQLVPQLGAFGGGIDQVLAMIASAGGGGGGLLGSVLNVVGGAALGSLGGASKAVSGGVAQAGSAFKSLKLPLGGKGFAGGGTPPVGLPFWVGENGRERMMLLPGGGAYVQNGPQARRSAAAGPAPVILNQTINIPRRTDPRRPASEVARATTGALARSNRRGLAIGPSFSVDN